MKKQNPRLQIIRGLPGSGKTTLALKRYPNLIRLETDMFFTRGGKYTFTKALNEKAVNWFNDEVFNCAYAGMDFVVTGVFAAHTERLDKTIRTAREFGYDVYIATLTNNFGNIHNVPKLHLDAMKADFVSSEELMKTYQRFKYVHFGLMSNVANGITFKEKRY